MENNKWNRIIISAGTLLVATSLATSAAAADEGVDPYTNAVAVAVSSGIEIPTRIVNEPRQDEPDGTCSTCSVEDLTIKSGSSNSTVAVLELYFDDNDEDEVADITIRVLLSSEEYRTMTIPSVELFDEQLHVFDLVSGPDWTWDDARYAWVEID